MKTYLKMLGKSLSCLNTNIYFSPFPGKSISHEEIVEVRVLICVLYRLFHFDNKAYLERLSYSGLNQFFASVKVCSIFVTFSICSSS